MQTKPQHPDGSAHDPLHFLSAQQRQHYGDVIREALLAYPKGSTDKAGYNLLASVYKSRRVPGLALRAKLRRWLIEEHIPHAHVVAAFCIVGMQADVSNPFSYAEAIIRGWQNPRHGHHDGNTPPPSTPPPHIGPAKVTRLRPTSKNGERQYSEKAPPPMPDREPPPSQVRQRSSEVQRLADAIDLSSVPEEWARFIPGTEAHRKAQEVAKEPPPAETSPDEPPAPQDFPRCPHHPNQRLHDDGFCAACHVEDAKKQRG